MVYLNKQHPRLSFARQCELLSVNRSSTYYKAREKEDIEIINEIRDIWGKYPFYGYRRITVSLTRKGINVNHKKVQRLMQEGGLHAISPRPKTSKKDQDNRIYPYLLNNIEITKPNQVWSTDITYIKLPQGYAYLVAIIDLYSRQILSWRLSNSLSISFCLEALNESLDIYDTPEIFNMDQGAQFTSDEWIYTLLNCGIKPSMTGVGRCLDNIYSERFWRTLKYENTYIYGYESMIDAREKIKDFIEFYNQQRPHQSLGYKTPQEVYNISSLRQVQPDGYKDQFANLGAIDLYTHRLRLTQNEGLYFS